MAQKHGQDSKLKEQAVGVCFPGSRFCGLMQFAVAWQYMVAASLADDDACWVVVLKTCSNDSRHGANPRIVDILKEKCNTG